MLGLRVHGQGPLERVQEDRVHDVAAAARCRGSSASPAATRRPSARRRSATATSTRRPTGASSSPTTAIGLFDNGGPNSLHAEPTIAAAEAGKHVICEKPLGRDADESLRDLARVAATGVKHLCAFNYRFVPAVRLAREMIEAGELGEIRHFRGRYLQDWGDDPTLDTWRFDADDGRLRRARRPRHARDRPRALPRRRDRVGVGAREDVRPRPPGRRRDRGGGRVRERRGRHDRGDAPRARPPQRAPVGDQRLEGVARVRHGAAERAPGVPRRRRPRARLQDRARLRGRPSVLGALVAARTHHRLGRHVRARAPPRARGDRRATATSRRTARRSRTATAQPRSCDAIVRSGRTAAPASSSRTARSRRARASP